MKKLIATLILLAAGPFMVWQDGAILSDFTLRNHMLQPSKIATSERTCRRLAFVFQHCSFRYQHEGEEQRQRYFLLTFKAPERLTMLQSVQTGAVTTNVGVDYFWNRISAILACLILGGFSLKSLMGWRFLNEGSTIKVAKPVAEPAEDRKLASQHRGTSGAVVQRSRSSNRRAQGFGRRTRA